MIVRGEIILIWPSGVRLCITHWFVYITYNVVERRASSSKHTKDKSLLWWSYMCIFWDYHTGETDPVITGPHYNTSLTWLRKDATMTTHAKPLSTDNLWWAAILLRCRLHCCSVPEATVFHMYTETSAGSRYHDRSSKIFNHDDVIKWKHFPRYWPFVRGIHRPPVNSPHKGQWRGALMFTLICARIKGWVNNREAGDFRRYRGHYDVTVMIYVTVTICVKHRPRKMAHTLC